MTQGNDACRPDRTATYNPQDDKLRLYAESRLDEAEYARVKALRMQWAPKQRCFYGVWNPAREDLLLEWCGHIEDDTGSREERAEERAARYQEYSGKRSAEAADAAAGVQDMTEALPPLGQPIMVGHHSERHASKVAKRIENGLKKAINLWDTAEYWQNRARASLAHAKYLEKPAVRYRRIKKLEAEKRGQERTITGHEKARAFWSRNDLTLKEALAAANMQSGVWGVWVSFCFPLSEYPRETHTYEGAISLWSALEDGIINETQAAALMLPYIERVVSHARRWLAHIENRIAFERAMLGGEDGDKALLPAQKWDLQPGGRVKTSRSHSQGTLLPILKVNKQKGVVTSLTVAGNYGHYVVSIENVTEYVPPTAEARAAVKKAMTLGPIVNYPGEGILAMTWEEWTKTPADHKRVSISRGTDEHGAYRYRRVTSLKDGSAVVFITDRKKVPVPPPRTEPDAPELKPVLAPASPLPAIHPTPDPENPEIKSFKARLKDGVKVVVADQLFPTPAPIVAQMLDLADLEPGLRILEPSAGTGNILTALADAGVDMRNVEAVELNLNLAAELRKKYPNVHQGDFLVFGTPQAGYDRILMNPPFKNGADIQHIRHALTLLKSNGVLVAICANGPRQQAKLKPLAEESGGLWEPLPENAFEGTGVHAALLQIRA